MAGFFVQRILQFNFSLATGTLASPGAPVNLSIQVASAISGGAAASVAAPAPTTGVGSDTMTLDDVQVTAKSPTVTQSTAQAQIQQPGQPLRAIVHIEFATMPATGSAQIRIWGMSLDHMNQLSKAGLDYLGNNNTVTVQAGDTVNGMVTVFAGVIIEAYADMNAQPETSFYILATPTHIMQLKPVPPTTFTGSVPAATALGQLAGLAGLTLENNGVPGVLQTPYFPGTAWQQIRKCVKALNCFAHVDSINKVLAVWPPNGNRAGQAGVISLATGMVGYPTFSREKIMVKQIFNSTITYQVGKQVTIQSQLHSATGTFPIYDITKDLACNIPDGPWFINVTATAPGKQQ